MGDTRNKASYSMMNYAADCRSSFDEQPFNQIDGLIMTQLSNMNLNDCGIGMQSGSSKTIGAVYDEIKQSAAFASMSDENRELLKKLHDNPRYSGMVLSNFVENPVERGVSGFSAVKDTYNVEIEQFAAVTISYRQNGKDVNYLSFRATDGTCDGWTEDVEMLTSNQTQAQRDAMQYMNLVGRKVDGALTGGGHSKGGNDFEYAYLFCDESVRQRITAGYVYDSPGLRVEILVASGVYAYYKKITDGNFICPQDSIIGMLLQESDNAIFVHSVESGFNEHDPYSWEISPTDGAFVLDKQSELSKYLNSALDVSVLRMTPAQRQSLWAFVYYIMQDYADTTSSGEDRNGNLDKLTRMFTGWKDEKTGGFKYEKFAEVFVLFAKDWNHLSEADQDEFVDSLGCILSSAIFMLPFYEQYQKISSAVLSFVDWAEITKRKIGESVQRTITGLSNRVAGGVYILENILNDSYRSFVFQFSVVSAWFNEQFGNLYHYAASSCSTSTYIHANTSAMRGYADRLNEVNKTIGSLDSKMDTLYWKIGLKDLKSLWTLLQADIRTSSDWHIRDCAKYLNDTANELENAEREVSALF